MRRLVVTAWLAVLASCGGGRPTDDGAQERPHRSAGHEPPTPPRIAGRPYATTPISRIATDLTELALAVARGRPAPETEAPLRSPLGDAEQTRWHTSPPRGELTVLGIAFELEVILKRGEPTDDTAPPARWGSLRLTLALSRNGLRLYSLRPRTMSRALPGGPLPSAMRGLDVVSGELLDALRAGDISRYLLDESDRALLNNDEVWAQVQDERVSPAHLTRVRSMLASLPGPPLGYRLSDVAVLAVDQAERIISFTLSWDVEGEGFVLETEPLVEVRQLWPLTHSGARIDPR